MTAVRNVAVFKDTDFASIVDDLAAVKAKIAALQEREAALKDQLAASGFQSVEGTEHRANICFVEGGTTTDWKAIAEKLNPSRQLISAHTKAKTGFWRIDLRARKTSR